MKVCIVGHGKSLEGAKKGEEIDKYHVMRLKLGWKLPDINPVDYGSRMDFALSSTETMGTLPPDPRIQCFAYPKYGRYEEHRVRAAQRWTQRRIVIPLALCNQWNKIFLDMGGKHPNVSLGMAAIVIAAGYLIASEIVLAGFDNIIDPDGIFGRIESIPRTGKGHIDHDWHTEHQLLGKIAARYNCDIKPI